MKTRITVVTDVLLYVTSFIMFIVSMLSMKYFSNTVSIFDKIIGNQDDQPIEDIVAARWRCPTDYQPLFKLYYWGIKEDGCYCPKIGKVITDLDCSILMQKAGFHNCIPWKKEKGAELKVWHTKTLCYKPYNMSEVEQIVVSQSEECPESYKNCGYYDIHKDKLCLRPKKIMLDLKCPVNYVNIFNEGFHYHNDPGMTKIALSDKRTFVFSRNKTDSYIPTRFLVSEGQPCVIKDRISNITQFFPYADVPTDLIGCDPYKTDNDLFYDKRYVKLDSYDAENFFIENDLGYLNNLPDIPNPKWERNKKQTFFLYYKSYIRMSADCMTDSDYFELVKFFKVEKYYQFDLLVIYLINMVVLGAFNSVLLLMKLNNKVQNMLVSLLKICFCIAVSCATLYIVNDAFEIGILAQNLEAKIVLDEHCLDPTTRFLYKGIYQLSDYLDYFDMLISVLLICSLLYAVLVFIQMLRFLYKAYFRIKKKLEILKEKKELS